MHLSKYTRTILFIGFLLSGLLLPGALPWMHSAQSFAQSGTPDLVITAITVTPENPSAGQEVDIVVTVKNQGDGPMLGFFNLYLYLNPSTDPPTESTPFTTMTTYGIPLPAGQSYVWTRTGQPLSTADTLIYAYVDPPWENNVAESNENNNTKWVRVGENPSNGDQYEDDDTCANAKAVLSNGPEQQRNLFRAPDGAGAADVDWVKFEGKANVTYLIEIIPEGADANLTGQMYSTCNLPGLNGGVKIEFNAPVDGTYYVKIRSNVEEYGPENDYRLRVTDDSGCTENFEVNDACSAAGQLGINTPQTHAFCKQDDVDWLHFPVSEGNTYKVSVNNLGENVEAKLSLLASCDMVAQPGSSSVITAYADGLYYIQLSNLKNSYGAGTDYSVQVEVVNRPEGDPFETDNSQTTAKTLPIGDATQRRNFYPAGDEDWAKFTAKANITYTIETINLGATSDPVLCLFDGNGTELACDDDSGAGEAARLIWRAPQGGDYFLQAKNFAPETIGPDTSYVLRIQEGSCNTDSFEPNNSRQNARALPVGGTGQQHNICPQADEDWVTLTVDAGTPYLLETTDVGADADTLLTLYGTDGTTVLAQNDDHTPGGASQIAYTFSQAGTYYAKVTLYNPTHYGTGTEYSLRLRTGTPATPTPTPTLPPTPTPTPTRQPAEARSLILVNRARIASLYGDTAAGNLMNKLTTLAQHERVQGTIVDLNENGPIRNAYNAWVSDITNVEKANAVAGQIRTLILNRWAAQGTIDYIVLVGEDRALPFYRVADRTTLYPEKTYGKTARDHATGAALYANYYLTDDYYADREPTDHQGQPLYIPDAAIGRLVESPTDMIKLIDAFLTDPITEITEQDSILVSGYDFVQDLAQNVCTDWQTDYANAAIASCELVSDNWTGTAFRTAQLRTNRPYKIQMIAGHADHNLEGAPDGNHLPAHVILSTNGLDLSGGLIYTPGCHAGLNVPPGDGQEIDLVQAFTSKGANYIGHTGYGWGGVNGIGWSEQLLQLFTRQLLTGARTSMGGALTTAKQHYVQQATLLDPYDEKILQTMIFYGLPMFEFQSAGVLAGEDDEFPGVSMNFGLPGGDKAAIGLNFTQALANADWFTLEETPRGNYYVLHHEVTRGDNAALSMLVPSTAMNAGQPVQPLHFGSFTPEKPARGVVLRSGQFRVQTNFNQMIGTPYNEYSAVSAAGVEAIWSTNNNTDAWYPPTLATVQQRGSQATLTTQIAQYNPASAQLRIYESAEAYTYYGDSSDLTPPTVLVVNGLVNAANNQVTVKVGATDTYGIQEVVVSYYATADATRFDSIDLTFDAAAQMWSGEFTGGAEARFFVQVVDNAGNVTTAHNKGRYYAPAVAVSGQGPTGLTRQIYLPVIVR